VNRALILATAIITQAAQAQEPVISEHQSIFHPIVGRHGMVSSQEATASRIGLDILRQGGNAVDAAVAVGFALAVTLPKAGNLGGGGFMLVHLADGNQTIAIDYREMAPLGASRDMFLDEDGAVNNSMARYSYRSAGVPGTVAGLLHALETYGTMDATQVITPAIELAERGFPLSHETAEEFKNRRSQLSRSKAGVRIFFKADGSEYQAGETFRQKNLAWSLKEIAEHGNKAFYDGAIAKRFVKNAQEHGGLITFEDLANYHVVERKPVRGFYRGYEIVSMPPPSSGGVHLVQILNILSNFDLHKMKHNSAAYIHVVAESMKYAYADRSKYLGDPDFVEVPSDKLLAAQYAKHLSSLINLDKSRPSSEIQPGLEIAYESQDTTHFSIADSQGNVVSNTYTLNFSYGSGIVIEGTGILLNNEMDDFSAKPGSPNAFGLLGGRANSISPGKRPLSAMTPTIVMKDGMPFLVVGSPGGSKIINVVLQVIINVLDHKMNIADATSVPRVHHQWFPDILNIERGISIDTVDLLRAKGHNVKVGRALGATQSIVLKEGMLHGSSDPRRPGAETLAY
jgi:gamma-glutamyltranspeptidase/glutathione hydrolase